MASSRPKKVLKRADFAKLKTKVGKSTQKPFNSTNTNFRAKSVVIKQQYVTFGSRSLSSQAESHLKLLTSHSENQRKESLGALLNLGSLEALPLAKLLPAALPLITDPSRGVRDQLLKLFRQLPSAMLLGYEQSIVLHLQIGLTHISPEICNASFEFLDWAMSSLQSALVTCRGGWFNILRTFMLLFGWFDLSKPRLSSNSDWNENKSMSTRLGTGEKALSNALKVLARFLQLGLMNLDENNLTSAQRRSTFGSHTKPHMLCRGSKGFADLTLFSSEADNEEHRTYTTIDDRRKVFHKDFLQQIEKGLALTRVRGGEAGRVAASMTNTLYRYIDEMNAALP